MAALQELLAASFRGVPFLVPSGTTESGRHGVKHDYPDANTRYVEDNGLHVPDYKIKCVISGIDALSRLRAFQGALDTPGPGTLVHPIYGRQFVQVLGPYTVHHDDTKIGVYEVECKFCVTGPPSFPGLVTGLAAAITGLSASTISAMFAAFSQGFDVPASLASLRIVGGALSQMAGGMIGSFGAVAQVQVIANRLMRAPEAAMSSPVALAGHLENLVRAPFETAKITVSNAELWTGYAALGGQAQAVLQHASIITPSTPDYAGRAHALAAIGTTMAGVAVASMCEAAAGKTYKTAADVSGDVEALHLAYTRFVDTATMLDAPLRKQISALVTETVAVLLKEQVSLPNIVTMTVHEVPPSVLCYLLYESDVNQQTLLDLNAGQSPLLFDRKVEILRA